MSVFTGSAVAIVTPFTADGQVNYPAFGKLIDFQIENGTDAIVVCGTTGEASTLTHEEHLECIRFCVERVAGRVPVIAGTGSNCTETAVYLTEEADRAGADAMLVVTPYYNKATQKGLIAHYTAIAACTEKPLILYNVPSRTGCNIKPETAATLFRNVKNIVGVKEASGDLSAVAEILARTNGEMDVYSGNDDQVVAMMALGAKGVISVLANVAPEATHEMAASYLRGDVEKAKQLQLKYFFLCKALFREVNPIPVKKAMNLMGLEAGSLRSPLSEMEPENAAVLEAEMRKVNLL